MRIADWNSRHRRAVRLRRIAGCALAAVLGAAAAMPGAGAGEVEAWDRARAFSEMERLRAEIRLLNGLAGAQAALLTLNRERAASGAGPAVLRPGLCADPALAPWCRALAETFGEGAAPGMDGGEAEETR